MPQLDTLSYFSQFFWFIIIFMLFYLKISLFLTPRLATVLKIRKKLLKNSTIEKDNIKESINIDNLILNSLTKK